MCSDGGSALLCIHYQLILIPCSFFLAAIREKFELGSFGSHEPSSKVSLRAARKKLGLNNYITFIEDLQGVPIYNSRHVGRGGAGECTCTPLFSA